MSDGFVITVWFMGLFSAAYIGSKAEEALDKVRSADSRAKSLAIGAVCWVLSPLTHLLCLALFVRYVWRAIREIFPAKEARPEPEPEPVILGSCPSCGHEPYMRQQ